MRKSEKFITIMILSLVNVIKKYIVNEIAIEFLYKRKSNPDNWYVLRYNSIILNRIIITNVINYIYHKFDRIRILYKFFSKLDFISGGELNGAYNL